MLTLQSVSLLLKLLEILPQSDKVLQIFQAGDIEAPHDDRASPASGGEVDLPLVVELSEVAVGGHEQHGVELDVDLAGAPDAECDEDQRAQ